MNLMIATAFLALATGVASAQALQAEIPSPSASQQGDGARTYQVKLANSWQHVVVLFELPVEGRRHRGGLGQSDPSKDWKASGAPMLTFECGISRCAEPALDRCCGSGAELPAPRYRTDERASVTEIGW